MNTLAMDPLPRGAVDSIRWLVSVLIAVTIQRDVSSPSPPPSRSLGWLIPIPFGVTILGHGSSPSPSLSQSVAMTDVSVLSLDIVSVVAEMISRQRFTPQRVRLSVPIVARMTLATRARAGGLSDR